jgi:predicted dehydrogenase
MSQTTITPVRWGILATGSIAASFTEDLLRLPDARVTAVGSRTAEAAERFAERYGIPHAHGSWQALAADPDVDVVYVATPHSAHHEATAICLDADRAVLCEKAFTVNLAQARDLVTRAADRGVFLMEAMWMYVNPVVRRLVDLVRDGAVGEVRLVQADFGVMAPADPTHRMWAPGLAGGALLDLGVYPVSFAHLLLGAPATISAHAALSPAGVDENTGILLGYDSGAVALLSCSLVTDTPHAAKVSGTRGRVEIANGFFNPDGFTLHRDGHEPEQVRMPTEFGNGYVHEAAEVMRCLRAGLTESPLVPLAGTLEIMATLDAIRDQVGVRYPGE